MPTAPVYLHSMIYSTLAAVAIVYSAMVGLLYLGQRSLMYQPTQDLGTPASHGIPEASPVFLNTSGGLELQSWYVPSVSDGAVILYFHGNAGHIGDRGSKVRPYVEAGYGVMLVGYRGYGGNPGSPTEEGLYEDAEAALSSLKELGIDPKDWVLYGESLGSGVAVEMALRYAGAGTPVRAVVLEAPFTSMVDAAANHYPFVPARTLVKDSYDSLRKISKISTNLLIFHGSLDRTVPFLHGQNLFEAALEPKRFHRFEGAHHNDLYDFGAARVVIDYLRS